MSPIKSQKIGFRVLEILFGAFLAVCIMVYSKPFESAFFPVIQEFTIDTVEEVPGGIELTGTMNKVRQCELKDMMVYVRTDDEQYPVMSNWKFDSETSNPMLLTKAPIEQSWGPWSVFIPETYESANLDIFTVHQCHSFYTTGNKISSFFVYKNEDGKLTLDSRDE